MSTLDPLIEGYLRYLTEVGRKVPRTVTDVRCTLKRASQAFEQRRPGVPLWKLALADYLAWIESERESGRSIACIAKYLSHVRGLLDYAWRSGRTERNVLDGFHLQDAPSRQVPNFLTEDQAERLVRSCPRGSPARRRDRAAVPANVGAPWNRLVIVTGVELLAWLLGIDPELKRTPATTIIVSLALALILTDINPPLG